MRPEQPDRPLTRHDRGVLAATLTVLGVVAALAHGCASTPHHGALPDKYLAADGTPKNVPPIAPDAATLEVVEAMSADYDMDDIRVVFVPCGEVNAYYLAGWGLIAMCIESRVDPLVEAFFAAHEMGHAITNRYAKYVDEEAADEIATLSLIEHYNYKPALAAAIHWLGETHLTWVPSDGHPTYLYRAWEIACLVGGSLPADRDPSAEHEACAEYYRATKLRWAHRLGSHGRA